MLIRFAFVTAFNAQEVGGDSLMPGKLSSVSEVVRSTPSGSHIALGGFSIARHSNEFPLQIPKESPTTPFPTAGELRLFAGRNASKGLDVN